MRNLSLTSHVLVSEWMIFPLDLDEWYPLGGVTSYELKPVLY